MISDIRTFQDYIVLQHTVILQHGSYEDQFNTCIQWILENVTDMDDGTGAWSWCESNSISVNFVFVHNRLNPPIGKLIRRIQYSFTRESDALLFALKFS